MTNSIDSRETVTPDTLLQRAWTYPAGAQDAVSAPVPLLLTAPGPWGALDPESAVVHSATDASLEAASPPLRAGAAVHEAVPMGPLGTDDKASTSSSNFRYLTGDSQADVLHGDGEDDAMWGADGDDALYGGQGNDVLQGGAFRWRAMEHRGRCPKARADALCG